MTRAEGERAGHLYLVYPNQPMLCCVGLLQHIQFEVFVADLSVPHSVITRWSLCGEDQ